MDVLTVEELEKKATDIVLQDAHVREDVKQLSKINYFLSLHYKRINTHGSVKETQYNRARSAWSVKLQEEMAVGKAENIAKSEAELEHGIFREENAEAQGISKIMWTIEGFIISIQSELKTLDNVQF